MNENREVLTRNECVSPKQMSVFILNLSQSQMYLENAKRTLFGLLWLRQIPRRRKQIDHDSHGCYAVYTLMFAKPLRRIEKKNLFTNVEKEEKKKTNRIFREARHRNLCMFEEDKNRLDENRTFLRRWKKYRTVRWRFSSSHFALISHWLKQNENISFQSKQKCGGYFYTRWFAEQAGWQNVNEVVLDQLSYQSNNIGGTLHISMKLRSYY